MNVSLLVCEGFRGQVALLNDLLKVGDLFFDLIFYSHFVLFVLEATFAVAAVFVVAFFDPVFEVFHHVAPTISLGAFVGVRGPAPLEAREGCDCRMAVGRNEPVALLSVQGYTDIFRCTFVGDLNSQLGCKSLGLCFGGGAIGKVR